MRLPRQVGLRQRHASLDLPEQMRLATTPSRGIRLTALLFYPRAHYPEGFDVQLPFAERVRAAAKETAVAGWRRRRDAHAVMTLDGEAARRWSAERGAPAYCVPEPTVANAPLAAPASARSGRILCGALGDRKGVDLPARALGGGPAPIRVTVAGEADSGHLPRLRELVVLTANADATERYAPALTVFAVRFSRKRFTEAVSKPFREEAGATVDQRPTAATRLKTPER